MHSLPKQQTRKAMNCNKNPRREEKKGKATYPHRTSTKRLLLRSEQSQCATQHQSTVLYSSRTSDSKEPTHSPYLLTMEEQEQKVRGQVGEPNRLGDKEMGVLK
jgi:hypothetical protein